MGEGQLKAVRLGAHLVNLERHLALPGDAIERETSAAPGAPAAVGTTDKEGAVRVHVRGDVAGAEAFQKRERSPLVNAVHLLEKCPVDHREGLVADKQLVLESAELAVTIVGESGGGVAQDAVREHDGRRHQLGNLGPLGHPAAVGLGLGRALAHRRLRGRSVIPAEAPRVALERAVRERLERA